MKRYLIRLCTLILVSIITLTSCSSASGLTGNYRDDTLNLISSLRTAIELPEDAPQKAEAQAEARDLINAFASRYRRDSSISGLSSFTTMQTALNGLASHYTSYPNRPVPEKLKSRLDREFKQIELSLKRES
ncbi:MAG: photosystem II protein Psb27 [Prochlorotrichaceae cyanobacterium]|jgi:photosystem II Psb27 protein